MKKIFLTSVFILFGQTLKAIPQTPIKQVTIYKNRANIQRTFKQQLKAGHHTITFDNLPINLTQDSLKVLVSDNKNIEVLGLQTEEIHILKNKNKEFQALIVQQKSLQDKIAILLQKAHYIYQQDENLNKISAHYQKSFIANINSKKWDPKNFKTFLSFLKKQDSLLFDLWSKYYGQYNQLAESLKKVDAKTLILGQNAQQSYITVNVNLNVLANKMAIIDLTYMVKNASWRPHYNLYIDSKKQSVIIEQNALISQDTGEDWDDCKVLLSNNPSSLKVKLPSLSPQQLSYKKVKAVKTKVQSTQTKNSNITLDQTTPQAQDDSVEKINKIFSSISKQTIKNGSKLVKIALNKKSTSYLEGLEVMASQNNIVYRLGEIKNPFKWALMAGESQIFYNAEYIQNFSLPYIPVQKTFFVNTGIIYNIFSDRYIKNKIGENGKIAGLLGKKKILKRHIKNLITNKSSHPQKLRILEQVPISQIEAVEVEFNHKNYHFKQLPHYPSWYYRDVTLAPNQNKLIEFDIKITSPKEFAFNWN